MRIGILLFWMIWGVFLTEAQELPRHDVKWMFGVRSDSLIPVNQGPSHIYIEDDTTRTFKAERDLNFFYTGISMCDAYGELLFWSNGIYINDASNQRMLGCDTLNVNSHMIDQILPVNGYLMPQSILSIPFPDKEETEYLLIHQREDWDFSVGPIIDALLVTTIDLLGNNGLGEVTSINQNLIVDTLNLGHLSACKHANGRDWWVYTIERNSNCYNRLLVDPDGIHGPYIQCIGSVITPFTDAGRSSFSPNGEYYASYDAQNSLNLFDFDRCTGLLSNPRHYVIPSVWASGGLAFSANSELLYVATTHNIQQFELNAPDFMASKDTVAIYDGYMAGPVNTVFYAPQLLPNGQILINSPSSVDVLHIIENPDVEGVGCNVVQHGIQLPTLNHTTMPYFPNYRLGPKVGSGCDTLTFEQYTYWDTAWTAINKPKSDPHQINVFPNPATTQLTIRSNAPMASIALYDISGRLVNEQQVNLLQSVVIDVQNLEPGLYFLELVGDKGVWKRTKKLVVE